MYLDKFEFEASSADFNKMDVIGYVLFTSWNVLFTGWGLSCNEMDYKNTYFKKNENVNSAIIINLKKCDEA